MKGEKEKKIPEARGEKQKKSKKITLSEFILITLVIMSQEFFEFLSNLSIPIPVIGQVAYGITAFLGWVISGILFLYLFLKGVKGIYLAAEGVVGLLNGIPIVAALPMVLVTWIVVYVLTNNPKLEGVARAAMGDTKSIGKALVKK